MSSTDQLPQPVCPKRIVRRRCAEAFGIDEYRMIGGNRARDVINPRHATFYVLRVCFPDISLPRIGRLMGGRDHSTILHGIRRIKAVMERDPALRAKVDALIAGHRVFPHDAHVTAWHATFTAPSSDQRWKVERAASVRIYDNRYLGAVAEGVAVIESRRDVKPKNALSPDDRDAVRRKVGSDALARAVRAAGGWPAASGRAA